MPTVNNILATAAGTLFIIAIIALWTVCPVISAMKGKYGMLVLGLLIHPCWAFAAIRLAKPDSYWARRFYGPEKMGQAQLRFTSNAPVRPLET